jgi:hypothetical protein
MTKFVSGILSAFVVTTLHPRKGVQNPSDRTVGGLQNRSERSVKEKVTHYSGSRT